jgi:predicted enzyme related to lactoylglutathione lyase
MIEGVSNIWMPVQDIDRAVDFYANKLGLAMVKQDGDWAEFEQDGLRIGLNGEEPEGARIGGGPVLTFRPDEVLEVAVGRFEGQGIDFAAGISDHPWGRVATFKDSEGNDLQLFEPPVSA